MALPRVVEPRKLAQLQVELAGTVDAQQTPRLRAAVQALEDLAASVAFAFDEHGRLRVRGTLKGSARMECQRCLGALDVDLQCEIDLIVVSTQERFVELSASWDCWLVLADQADLYEVLEDEWLLALPYVARHGYDCADIGAVEDVSLESGDNPFAVLKQLKRSGEDDSH